MLHTEQLRELFFAMLSLCRFFGAVDFQCCVQCNVVGLSMSTILFIQKTNKYKLQLTCFKSLGGGGLKMASRQATALLRRTFCSRCGKCVCVRVDVLVHMCPVDNTVSIYRCAKQARCSTCKAYTLQ
jgi:hypothetical protein